MAGRALLSSQNGLYALAPLSSIGLRSNSLVASVSLFRRWPAAPISSSSRCRSHLRTEAEPFVITTPLYYVNAPPHMGSAYTTIAADAIARFQRLLEKKVIFITGTDEHGEKIAAAAEASGKNPSEHCDIVSHAYQMLWKEAWRFIWDTTWGCHTAYRHAITVDTTLEGTIEARCWA